jgi:hypothetical protein
MTDIYADRKMRQLPTMAYRKDAIKENGKA